MRPSLRPRRATVSPANIKQELSLHRPLYCCEGLESRRMLNAGDLDNAFGVAGRQSLQVAGKTFSAYDIAIQVDGKTLLSGARIESNGVPIEYGVVRLNVNGSFDATFGAGGFFGVNRLGAISGIDVDGTDGTIVLCGSKHNASRGVNEFAVVRLMPNGVYDTSFGGGDALVTIQFDGTLEDDSVAKDIMIQRDHKILAVGERFAGFFNVDWDLVLARFNVDGSLDNSFDSDGKVVRDLGNDEYAEAVTIDYTGNSMTNPRYGQIVVAGWLDTNSSSRFAVARFTPSGQPDNTFDGDGALTTVFASGGTSTASGVVVQAGSKIVVTGTHEYGSGASGTNFMTIRYNVNGSIDSSFGPIGTGYVETDLDGIERAGTLATSYGGGLLVGGVSGTNGLAGKDLAIAAYTENGILDTRFSGDGLLRIGGGGQTVGTLAVTGSQIAPVRKIVIAGNGGLAARVVDVGSLISVSPSQPTMLEQGAVSGSFIVSRTQARPFAETIILSTSGNVTTLGANRDFNGTNILFGNGQTTSTEVTIPAGATSVTATLTPIDDVLTEADETITFTVGTTLTYDAGTNNSTTLLIRDNDYFGAPAVIDSGFNFEAFPQNVTFTFNQNVQSTFTVGDLVVTGPAPTPPPYLLNYSSPTNTGTVVFYSGPLPDGNYTVKVKGSGVTVNGQPMAADYAHPLFFLNADANRDRKVDTLDFNLLAGSFGMSGKVFSDGNFDYDANGNVDSLDFNILTGQYGKTLPPPPPAALVAASALFSDQKSSEFASQSAADSTSGEFR